MPPNSFLGRLILKLFARIIYQFIWEKYLRDAWGPLWIHRSAVLMFVGPGPLRLWGKLWHLSTCTLPLVLQTRSGGHKLAEPTHGLRLGSCPTPQRAESLDSPYHPSHEEGLSTYHTLTYGGGTSWAVWGEEVMWNVTQYSVRAPKGLRWVFISGGLVFLFLEKLVHFHLCFTFILFRDHLRNFPLGC